MTTSAKASGTAQTGFTREALAGRILFGPARLRSLGEEAGRLGAQ